MAQFECSGKYIQSGIKQGDIHTVILWTLAMNARLEVAGGTPLFPLAYEHFINTSEEYDMPLKVSRVFPRSNLKIPITVNIITFSSLQWVLGAACPVFILTYLQS